MKGWTTDLFEGQIGEIVVAGYLMNKMGFTHIHINNDGKYDVRCRKKKYWTIEVKTDRYEWNRGKKTNNIFIETECHGKPSGIKTTEADIWITYFPDQDTLWSIYTNDLKKFLEENKSTLAFLSNAGHDGKAKGFLISKEEWGHLFRVTTIPKDEIGSILFP